MNLTYEDLLAMLKECISEYLSLIHILEGTMRELNTMHITNYTPRFRKTNSLGRRQLLTHDEMCIRDRVCCPLHTVSII